VPLVTPTSQIVGIQAVNNVLFDTPEERYKMVTAQAKDLFYGLYGETPAPLDPVPAIVDTIAEFYASGLYLARNNLPDGQTQYSNLVLAEKKLAEYSGVPAARILSIVGTCPD
jgi:hypothetical protein